VTVLFGRLSLALRIALASAMFGLLIAAAAIIVGYAALSQQLQARAEAEVRGKQDLIVHVLSEMPSAQTVTMNMHRVNDLLIGHTNLHLALASEQGDTLLSASSGIAAQSVRHKLHQEVSTWLSENRTELLGLRQVAATANGSKVVYYLSLDLEQNRDLLANFLGATLLGLPLLLLVVSTGAWLIARTGLSPLRRFHRLAATVSAQSLGRRVSDAELPAELAELAREFNGMLERIDAGYQRLQEFSGDLAHEMRTPLATLLGRSQVALSQLRTGEELREVIVGNIEELERLARLTADMLFIAQADQNETVLRLEKLQLDAEVMRVADYLSLIAEDKGLEIAVRGRSIVNGDRLLIERAITNLLSNAIRHAEAGSVIEVNIRSSAHWVELCITNRGEPISAEHVGRIFDRFYRVDSARARLNGGTGLGLAIVRSIIHAHAGSVWARSDTAAGTTNFCFRLPGEAAEQEEMSDS